MGLRYGKRNRMEDARDIPDEVLVSLGSTNIKYEKFDEQITADKINTRLDEQQKRIDNL